MGTLRLLGLLALLPSFVAAAILETDADPTAAEVQAIHDDAGTVDGDVILLPEGTFLWTTQLSITKAITLRGAGGGGILLGSYTAHLLGTGSKTFTMDTNHFRGAPDITIGETLRVYFLPDGTGRQDGTPAYMEGAVTAYAYPDVTIDVTTAVGNGSAINGSVTRFVGGDDGLGLSTENNWLIAREPKTVIQSGTDYGSFQGQVTATASSSGNIAIEEIAFHRYAGGAKTHLTVTGSESAEPVIVRNCWFRGSNPVDRSVVWKNNHGVMTGCTWDCGITVSTSRGAADEQGLVPIPDDDTTSWTRTSTMGTDDTDGNGNLYVEDSYVQGHWSTFVDMEDNCRFVFRYSILDGSNIGGHEDSRHFQNYKNGWRFRDDGLGRTPNTQGFQGGRAGTGVVYGNYATNINSSSWGDKSEFSMKVYLLRSFTAPGKWQCWGNATPSESEWPATEYPAPRQPGMGYVDGSGTTLNDDYLGDFEPIYSWGNTGYSFTPSVADAGTVDCTTPDTISAYVRIDTDGDASIDGEVMVGVAKPGWEEYPYPHPLTVLAGAAYGGRIRFNGTGSKPIRTDGVGQPIIFDQ